MKLSKLFHSLYAVLMFLPVMVIPIFAININQKSVEPISIEVQEKMSVNFNQKRELFIIKNNAVATNNNNISLSIDYTFNQRTYFANTENITTYANHKYVCTSATDLSYLTIHKADWSCNFTGNGITTASLDNTYGFNIEVISDTYPVTIQDNININIFDLTQMFGVGNEPTYQEFVTMFPNPYYPYTESQKMLVNRPTPTTYDDTDIGSQFLYSLYIPVKEYFNFGNFFGLNGMYDWFTLNIFNGTAPLSFFIVFNVMIYWLFISLFWLLFDILIYVPMLIHRWLDKASLS